MINFEESFWYLEILSQFKRLEYYLGIIDAAASTESDVNIIIFQEDGPASAENKTKYTIKRFIQPKINDVLNNRNYLTENLSSTDPNGFINKLINKFKENLKSHKKTQ